MTDDERYDAKCAMIDAIFKGMTRSGLTRAGLADRAGLSPSFVSDVLRGRRPMNCRTIERIARALDLSKSEIRGLSMHAARAAGWDV